MRLTDLEAMFIGKSVLDICSDFVIFQLLLGDERTGEESVYIITTGHL
jgi:hypothetical protein